MKSQGHKIPCPKCKQPLRHRGLSNLYWCNNPQCATYKGVPPIKVNAEAMVRMGEHLRHAMSDEVWAKVDDEIRKEDHPVFVDKKTGEVVKSGEK